MTLAKRILPCLDVDAGRVVKGTRFVDLRAAYSSVASLVNCARGRERL